MFKILQRSLATGVVTTGYPDAPAQIAASFRGVPRFDFANWRDARPAAAVCPKPKIVPCCWRVRVKDHNSSPAMSSRGP